MTRHHPCLHASAQRGASLLEVLITILILSFGLLGVAGLTAVSLQTAKLAQFQSVGLQLANDYADRMRGNTQLRKELGATQLSQVIGQYAMTDAYTGATAAQQVPACANSTNCSSTEMASIDRAEWINSLRRRLPGGSAYVTYGGPSANNDNWVDIWIIWQEPDMRFDPAGTGGNQCPDASLGDLQGELPPVGAYYRVRI